MPRDARALIQRRKTWLLCIALCMRMVLYNAEVIRLGRLGWRLEVEPH